MLVYARLCSEQFILIHLILTTTLYGRFNYGPILQNGKLKHEVFDHALNDTYSQEPEGEFGEDRPTSVGILTRCTVHTFQALC